MNLKGGSLYGNGENQRKYNACNPWKRGSCERGISILDLIGNQHDVEDFFYSILDEVDTDHEFRDNGAVTFQLVPSGDGVELFITKVDPEAAEKMNLPKDAEFDENNSVMLSNLTPDELDQIGLDKDVTRILKDRMKGNFKTNSKISERHRFNSLKKQLLIKRHHSVNNLKIMSGLLN